MAAGPLATAFVLIRPSTAGFGPTLKRELDGAASAAGAAGSKAGTSWSKAFSKSGVVKVANRISEGVVAIGAASVYAAVQFQSSMEKLATQAGVSQGKVKGLGDGILKLAGQVGFSPDSLATSLYHVESSFESLGITSTKALAMVKIAAEGAAVGGANLEDVTNALTAVMASGIRVTHGMSGAMGILNQIVGVGDMKMQDLADAFGTGLLASIKGFGVSITDAGAALATFGDNNIRGAKAGQQLRMAIQALAAPTGEGKKILESWGLNMSSLAADMRKGGLRLALEDLQKQFRKFGIGTKEQGQFLTQMFGKRAGVGIQILVGQMDRFNSKFDALRKSAGGFGDAWKKTQATAGQQMKELGHGLEAVGVQIGQKLLPPLMSVFGFIKDHTGLVLGLAAGIGAMALAISAVSVGIKLYQAALALAVVWSKLVTIATYAWDFALNANPIGLVIAAIALLVGAIIYAYTHFKWFRDFVQTVWTGIRVGAEWLWNALKIGFDAVWGFLKTVWHGLKQGFDDVWGAIKSGVRWLVSTALGMLGLLIDGAAKLFGWLPAGVGKDLQAAAAKFDQFREHVNAALGGISPRSVTVGVSFDASAHYGHQKLAARGWYVSGGQPGRDSVPILGMPGELVVPRHMVAAGEVDHLRGRIPGFARGGLLGVSASAPSQRSMEAAVMPPLSKLAQLLMASGVFTTVMGAAIAKYATSFVGRVPYVWGGTTPAGWDCSGFTSFVYDHFGFRSIPRTAAQQQQWARHVPSPITGGLIFMAGADGTAGAAGHVGIVVGPNRMANAFGTGFGTILSSFASGGPFGGFGIPPQGFDRGGWLRPGLTLAYNGTGRPERVIAGGSGGGTVNVYVTVPVGASPVEVARQIADVLNKGAMAGVRLRRSIVSASG